MKIEKYRVMLAISAIMVIVGAIYSNNMQRVDAISVVSVTFPAGSTTTDVTYRSDVDSTTNSEAWVIGQNAGQAYTWKKNSNNQIINNATLTGSSSARAIEYDRDIIGVYAVTNAKFYKINTANVVSIEVANGLANVVIRLIYDHVNDIMYYCTNDGYGSLNRVTLSTTSLYNDPQLNSVLDCALDMNNRFMYLSGDNIGSSGLEEVIKVSTTTHTQVAQYNDGANQHDGICFDSRDTELWGVDGDNARVRHFDANFNIIATVAVGSTPRDCTIEVDNGARRLYVVNAIPNTVSIIDIDADIVISTPSVCDNITTNIDSIRLFNTTNTYITCNSATNSVIIDDTVSEAGSQEGVTVCVDINPLPDFTTLQCFTDNNGDGIPDQQQDTPISPFNATFSGYTIGCQIGLIDCANPNPQTNGVGYFYLLFLMLASVGIIGYLVTWKLSDVHIMIWIMVVVINTGIAFFLKWTDGIIFFFSLVAVIAFAGVKVAESLRS